MIEGKLVNLRARELSDVERMTRWINDREVTRFMGNSYPWSSAAEEAFVRSTTSVPMAFGDLRFAIETKDGAHIGGTGLHRATPENRAAEMGIMIGEKKYWSKGYGTDAVATLLRFAFEEMNPTASSCTCSISTRVRRRRTGSADSWRRGGCARRTTPTACTAMWW